MKKLSDMLESILGNDLDDKIDKQVSSDFGDWIIEYWKDTEWQEGGSLYNRLCWYDDREDSCKRYEDFGYEAKKKGRKWKSPRKVAEQMIRDKKDVTIICISFLNTNDVCHIGIGNPAKKDVLNMSVAFCPYRAKLDDQEQRLTVWCPSIMSNEPPGNSIWWDLAGEGNAKVKKDYYVIPEIYWERIKKAIL